MTTISVPYFMGERLEGFDPPGPAVAIDPPLAPGSPQQRMGSLYRDLAGAVAAAEVPIVWAGDCVASLGVLAGLQRNGLDPTLIWFDAHGDFNTWETTPSGFIGGMPLAMAVGLGEQTIVDAVGLRPVAEADAALVGARDLDAGEAKSIDASGLTVLDVAAVIGWEPPPGPLYVHVDVDVVDPGDMPAMNYPAPGGPSLDDVIAAVEALAGSGRVVAASMSLWNPALPGARRAAAGCRRIAAAFSPVR